MLFPICCSLPADTSGQSSQPDTSSSPSSAPSGASNSGPSNLQQEQQAAGEDATAAAAKLAQQPGTVSRQSSDTAMMPFEQGSDPVERSLVDQWLNPDKSELPGDFNMPIWVCLSTVVQTQLPKLHFFWPFTAETPFLSWSGGLKLAQQCPHCLNGTCDAAFAPVVDTVHSGPGFDSPLGSPGG